MVLRVVSETFITNNKSVNYVDFIAVIYLQTAIIAISRGLRIMIF